MKPQALELSGIDQLQSLNDRLRIPDPQQANISSAAVRSRCEPPRSRPRGGRDPGGKARTRSASSHTHPDGSRAGTAGLTWIVTVYDDLSAFMLLLCYAAELAIACDGWLRSVPVHRLHGRLRIPAPAGGRQ